MIRGKNVILRQVREAELDRLLALFNDVASRGEHFVHALYAEPAFKKDYRETGFWSRDKGRFLVCDRSEAILGTIDYFREPAHYNGLEIGAIVFDAAQRGQGHMTEALTLAVDYLFSTKPINRIQVAIMPRNEAAKIVVLRCGFSKEGTARGALFHGGTHQDLEIFSILRDEPRPSHGTSSREGGPRA